MVSIIARHPPEIRQPISLLLILGLRMLGRHPRFPFSCAKPWQVVRRRGRTIARAECLSARSSSPDVHPGRRCAITGRLESLRNRSKVSGDIDRVVLTGEELGSISDRVEVGDLRPVACCSFRVAEGRCKVMPAFRVCAEFIFRTPVTTESPWKKDEYRRRAQDLGLMFDRDMTWASRCDEGDMLRSDIQSDVEGIRSTLMLDEIIRFSHGR